MKNAGSINGDVLMAHGWQAGKPLGLALKTAARMSAEGAEAEDILAELDAVLSDPTAYASDAVMGDVAKALVAALP
jgi:hypothetical protein